MTGKPSVPLAAVAVLALATGQALAATGAGDAASSDPASRYATYEGDGEIHPWHAQGDVWLMAGEPGMSNVTVQVGDQGVLVVDTGAQPMAGRLLAQIERVAQEHAGDQKAIRYVVDTDGRPDHIGGNAVLRTAGSIIVGGNFRADNPGLTPGATVMAHQNVLMRLVQESSSGSAAALPQALWPTDTEDFDVYNKRFNGEAVQLLHPRNATSDGNLMVMFRRSDVIVTGDVVDLTGYPHIDPARGGTIDGELVALNHLIEMAVPDEGQQGGTMVIPGHGRVGDQVDVVHYKDMLTVIRNRIQFYRDQGRSLQQVLTLKPTWDYDARWGHDSGPWTTRSFVEAVYTTVPARGPVFSMRNQAVVPATAATTGGKAY